jgi:hypothetical protein
MFFWRLAKLKRPSFNLTFDVSVIGRSVPTRGAFALCLLQRDHWLSQTLSSLFLSYERLTKREGSSGYRLFRIANPDHDRQSRYVGRHQHEVLRNPSAGLHQPTVLAPQLHRRGARPLAPSMGASAQK